MYIGGVDRSGLHHLVWEILDNSIDEVINGHASTIEVELDSAARGVKITDATPDLFKYDHSRRAIEILTWVSEHAQEIEHWVAIDDDYLPLDYEHYVNTELWTRDDEGQPVLGDDGLPNYQGLTEAKAQELERKLMLYE